MSAETWAFAIVAFVAGAGFGASAGLIWALWHPPAQLRSSPVTPRGEGKA